MKIFGYACLGLLGLCAVAVIFMAKGELTHDEREERLRRGL